MAVFFSAGVYRVGGGVSVPKLITSTLPEYTAEARAARIEGTAELLLVIGEDGEPHNVQVQKALGYGLDEKAIECVVRWRFNPGVYQDKPVPVAATLVVVFRLEPLLLR
jgi:TonB family protein